LSWIFSRNYFLPLGWVTTVNQCWKISGPLTGTLLKQHCCGGTDFDSAAAQSTEGCMTATSAGDLQLYQQVTRIGCFNIMFFTSTQVIQ
jgi:hypothetical protein